jgi:hypothetical protein
VRTREVVQKPRETGAFVFLPWSNSPFWSHQGALGTTKCTTSCQIGAHTRLRMWAFAVLGSGCGDQTLPCWWNLAGDLGVPVIKPVVPTDWAGGTWGKLVVLSPEVQQGQPPCGHRLRRHT